MHRLLLGQRLGLLSRDGPQAEAPAGHRRRCRDGVDGRKRHQFGFEHLPYFDKIDVFPYDAGPLRHEHPVDVDAQVEAAHVVHLGIDGVRADQERNRRRKLEHDEPSPQPVFGEGRPLPSFQDRDRLKGRKHKSRIEARQQHAHDEYPHKTAPEPRILPDRHRDRDPGEIVEVG